MPRNRRRARNGPSSGSLVTNVLSILLFVGLSVTVVVLRAQRRAAWRDAQSGRTDDGGGFHAAPEPPQHFDATPPTPPAGRTVPPSTRPAFAPPQFVPAGPDPRLLKPGVRQTPPEGGAFASIDYQEYRQDGALLVGFELGLGKVFNTDIISFLRPIWLTSSGEKFGTAYGRTERAIVTVKARDGYAVGGVVVAGGGALEGIAFTFMRRGEKCLVVDDTYVSPWYGEQSRKPSAEGMASGDGSFVIGIFGKRFEDKRGRNFDDGGAIATIGLTLWVPE